MDRNTLKQMMFDHEFNPMESITYLIQPTQDFIRENGVEAYRELQKEVCLEAAEIKRSSFNEVRITPPTVESGKVRTRRKHSHRNHNRNSHCNRRPMAGRH